MKEFVEQSKRLNTFIEFKQNATIQSSIPENVYTYMIYVLCPYSKAKLKQQTENVSERVWNKIK